MDIITNQKEIAYQSKSKIYVEDLDEYGHGLWNLIQMYRKHIFVNDDETEKILQELEYYAIQLINRQYQNLIMHSEEIVVKDPNTQQFNELKDSEYPF